MSEHDELAEHEIIEPGERRRGWLAGTIPRRSAATVERDRQADEFAAQVAREVRRQRRRQQ